MIKFILLNVIANNNIENLINPNVFTHRVKEVETLKQKNK